MKYKHFLSALLFLFPVLLYGQKEYRHWNPANDPSIVVYGQEWRGELKAHFDRLPARAEGIVRKEVWDESEQSAGLHLRFRTNTSEIVIRYTVARELQFPHMPATGVSGVDMYARNKDGKWLWCGGKFSFGDTITYRFSGLIKENKDYYLYLPLYNRITWMDISIPGEDSLTFLSPEKEKPIVVYGTSIAQGGCASRAGLAWTNMLSRNLDWPVVNLGFSGNGRLEQEVQSFIGEIDARLFVLDCLPNLTSDAISASELNNKIVNAVVQLRTARPGIPILLTQHDGYTGGEMQSGKSAIDSVNTVMQQAFDSLHAKKFPDLYLLTEKEIGQDLESMVDGIHPNDLGMLHYSNAYEKKIREIFHIPKGTIATTIPVRQRRDFKYYDWETRHRAVLLNNRENPPQVVFIGNSITHYWAGKPVAPIARGEKSWTKFFDPLHTANLGFGWDRIENVLWRMYHGELDSITPRQIVLMIGTNNIPLSTDSEIVEGLQFLIARIKERQPQAKILLMAIFPRRNDEAKIAALNLRLKKKVAVNGIQFADAGSLFLKADKKLNESLFTDGLHPNEAGYEKLGAFILARIKNR